MFRHLHSEDVVIPANHTVESVLPMHRDQRQALVIQVEETDMSVNHRLNSRRLAILEDGLKASEHFLRHGQLPCARIRLCRLNDVLHCRSSLQLLVYVDDSVLHIQVADRQPAELGNAHSCMKQDEDRLIVFAIAVVVPYKFQELPHLVPSDGLASNAVVDNNTGKLEGERILNEQIVIDCHLESRAEYAANCLDGGIAAAVFLELYEKQLRMR